MPGLEDELPEPWQSMINSTRSLGSGLDLHLGAGLLQLLLDLFGLFLGDAFLDGLGRALDDLLGLLEAEAGELTQRLDDADLLGAEVGEDDVELGGLCGGLNSGASGGASRTSCPICKPPRTWIMRLLSRPTSTPCMTGL